MKNDKSSKKDGEEKKKFDLIGGVIKFFYESLFPSELGNINRCLVKANELAPSPYFMRLLLKNRFWWFVASFPSLLNIGLLFLYFNGRNTVVSEVLTAYKILIRAFETKNHELVLQISFSENFIVYLVAIIVQVIALTALSWIFMAIIKRINPIIRESLELRDYCRSKNYSNDNDNLFLVCKAGILAKISESSGDDLSKDKHLWRHLNKIPKDPVESPKDRSIVFIGNGFQLQKYEFKIT